mmetsp:Transcript_36606/g.115145  ORF Transcript_36606/g.115145 Transcript_36606/m.115145 type:complete len:327 (-) Transcript_36606:61-1041(-)
MSENGKPAEPSRGSPISVIVHGGAWAIPDAIKEANLRACEEAAARAYALLREGGSALDAVEAAVRWLEDEPSLNSGRGCSLNERGEPECDAMIMEGSLRCGAVASVQVGHPVTLARRVMERTEHVFLAGQGAMDFAAAEGLLPASRDELVTPAAEEEWRTWREYGSNVRSLFARHEEVPSDTVGCAVLDASGALACATSTGGVVGKRPGRVGDSPLVGSGGYADAYVGASSSTGHGEAIAKVTLARLALWLMEEGHPPTKAAERALETMQRRCGSGIAGGGTGGLILVARSGEVAKAFTTRRMVWASVQGQAGQEGKRSSGIERDE